MSGDDMAELASYFFLGLAVLWLAGMILSGEDDDCLPL